MQTNKVLIAAIFAMTLVSAMMVSARHLESSPSDDLVEAASDLTHALESSKFLTKNLASAVS